MPNTREKLIELLYNADDNAYWDTSNIDFLGKIADHLIANGVTFATDNNVGDKMTPTADKWIPVTERLPEREQEVIVYAGNVLKPSVYCYHFWEADMDSWARVTHWMHLPEPPQTT